MKVLLHAWGSRGDVQPALALALRLQERGHRVAIAAMVDFGDWIRGHGVTFEPIETDLAELSATPAGRRYLGGSASTLDDLNGLRRFLAAAAGPLAAMLVRTRHDYDAVVTNPITLEATLCLSLSPSVGLSCAMLQPGVASADARSTMYAVRPGRSIVNQMAGGAATIYLRHVLRPVVDATVRLAGASRLSWAGYIRRTSQVQYFLASSPLVTPVAADWPVPIEATGFWQLPPDPRWEPDPHLAEFLTVGPPPIYVGFGSAPTNDAGDMSRLIRAVVTKMGLRAVVLRGTAGLAIDHPDVLLIDAVPHDWLFPRTSVAVSHGGAGTTAAALTAGTPQVVVPHMADQPFWGRRVHELGVSPAPIPAHQMTADALALAIEEAQSAAHRRAAMALAEQLRDETGTANAVAALERQWSVGLARGRR
ncbi:MAG: glycosyltransferase [Actinobacteria bacterium]|nr:glycosyltransferase [Actinomycetota bacterium]